MDIMRDRALTLALEAGGMSDPHSLIKRAKIYLDFLSGERDFDNSEVASTIVANVSSSDESRGS